MDTVTTVVGAAQGLTRQPPELYDCKTEKGSIPRVQ